MKLNTVYAMLTLLIYMPLLNEKTSHPDSGSDVILLIKYHEW